MQRETCFNSINKRVFTIDAKMLLMPGSLYMILSMPKEAITSWVNNINFCKVGYCSTVLPSYKVGHCSIVLPSYYLIGVRNFMALGSNFEIF